MPQQTTTQNVDEQAYYAMAEEELPSHKETALPLGSLFAAVVRQSRAFIGIADRGLRLVFLNETGRTMAGLQPDDEISTIPIPDLFHPADQAVIRDVALPMLVREGCWEGEVRPRHSSDDPGTTILCRAFALHDESGTLIGLAMTGLDISARKLAESHLRASEARLQSAIDLVGLSPYAWDPRSCA